MPWEQTTKKDAASGETSRGGAEQPLIREYPNGETLYESCRIIHMLQGI